MELICEICNSSKVKELFEDSHYSVMCCSNCKVAFTLPPPHNVDYNMIDFHGDIHEKDDQSQSEHSLEYDNIDKDWRNTIDIQLSMVKKHLETNSRILDVGCGDGLFLRHLMKHGYENVSGIDPSIEATKRAQAKNLKVVRGVFPEVQPEEPQKLVILSHVLEHIEHPFDFIEGLKKILDDKGMIMLNQTNHLGILPRTLKSGWGGWVPEQHYWHFSKKGLKILFGRLGLSLIEASYSNLITPTSKRKKLTKFFPSLSDQMTLLFRL